MLVVPGRPKLGSKSTTGQCHSSKPIPPKSRLFFKKLLFSKKTELRKLGATGVMLDKRRWGEEGGPKAATEARRGPRRVTK
ncbi:unnamed protein product [Fusarium graminearum]|uniref:Chromosome 1, complete genome n=2 Tax=Gibberella zeae TaxID=5518 RepID=A0A098D9B5_GIBZE|nr:unnamed protein product [Fusarium graminearum]CAG1972544.1 unnamed protein product [Fusarium graminearum]CAG2012968.1 unnamed protein product [Fusarium graminearum]CEF75050.1 unnamed protein product [Fusarium graminearum]